MEGHAPPWPPNTAIHIVSPNRHAHNKQSHPHLTGHAERVPPKSSPWRAMLRHGRLTQPSKQFHQNGTPTTSNRTCTYPDTRSASLQNPPHGEPCSAMAAEHSHPYSFTKTAGPLLAVAPALTRTRGARPSKTLPMEGHAPPWPPNAAIHTVSPKRHAHY